MEKRAGLSGGWFVKGEIGGSGQEQSTQYAGTVGECVGGTALAGRGAVRGTLAAAFVEAAEVADDPLDGLFSEVFYQRFCGHNFRLRDEPSGCSPETPYTGESFGNGLLCFLIEVLAEIATTPHVPRYEVGGMAVESLMLDAFRFGNSMPDIGEDVTGTYRVFKGREEVKMGGSSPLKLENPEVANTREFPPHGGQEGVEMRLDRAAVRIGTMIGHTELGYEGRKRIA